MEVQVQTKDPTVIEFKVEDATAAIFKQPAVVRKLLGSGFLRAGEKHWSATWTSHRVQVLRSLDGLTFRNLLDQPPRRPPPKKEKPVPPGWSVPEKFDDEPPEPPKKKQRKQKAPTTDKKPRKKPTKQVEEKPECSCGQVWIWDDIGNYVKGYSPFKKAMASDVCDVCRSQVPATVKICATCSVVQHPFATFTTSSDRDLCPDCL